jgi:DNA-3-methyladenine glycosylase I
MGGDQVAPAARLPDGIAVGDDGVARCWWGAGDPLYRRYHDTEWGRPVAEDRRLFEKLSLEGFQAGLSWLTILRKRERFREVFPASTPRRSPGSASRRWSACWPTRASSATGPRSRRPSTTRVGRYAELAEEFGSLAGYVWQYEPDPQSRPPLLNHATLLQLGQSPESAAMSKDLRRRGWSFVGPTTVYAFMEAMGLVNDHLEGCHRRLPVERERQRFRRPAIATGGMSSHPNTGRSPRR